MQITVKLIWQSVVRFNDRYRWRRSIRRNSPSKNLPNGIFTACVNWKFIIRQKCAPSACPLHTSIVAPAKTGMRWDCLRPNTGRNGTKRRERKIKISQAPLSVKWDVLRSRLGATSELGNVMPVKIFGCSVSLACKRSGQVLLASFLLSSSGS